MRLDPGIAEGFYEMTGVQLVNDYGSTETGLICLNQEMDTYPQSVGRVIPGSLITVVDERGDEMPRGTTGQICVKSTSTARAYLYPAQENRKFTTNGYLTGDYGVINEDGCVYIEGRIDDIANIGGEKVSVKEVEHVIVSMPGVTDAAVIAVEDYVRGSLIIAYVVTDYLTKAELLAHCEKNLAIHKLPTIIHFVPSIPRSESGKLLKKYLDE
jgi:long-chain acyl-CoA synthetase